MKFEFVVNPEKRYVIAMAKSDGKVIKGIAKCSPTDVFDEALGKKLAAARCKLKIMKRQALEAADIVDFYRELKEEHTKSLRAAEQFAWNQYVKVDEAEKELAEVISATV